jgi:hypothetical protein
MRVATPVSAQANFRLRKLSARPCLRRQAPGRARPEAKTVTAVTGIRSVIDKGNLDAKTRSHKEKEK